MAEVAAGRTAEQKGTARPDPQGKAFATETLPKGKAHLDKIMKIAADAGVSSQTS